MLAGFFCLFIVPNIIRVFSPTIRLVLGVNSPSLSTFLFVYCLEYHSSIPPLPRAVLLLAELLLVYVVFVVVYSFPRFSQYLPKIHRNRIRVFALRFIRFLRACEQGALSHHLLGRSTGRSPPFRYIPDTYAIHTRHIPDTYEYPMTTLCISAEYSMNTPPISLVVITYDLALGLCCG